MPDLTPDIRDYAFALLRRNGMRDDRDLLALVDIRGFTVSRGRVVPPANFVSDVKRAKPNLFPGAELDALTMAPADATAALEAIVNRSRSDMRKAITKSQIDIMLSN
jgi:hypothetical protein